MEKSIVDFAQLSRASAKTFLNFPHFQRSLKLFRFLFNNSYNHFVALNDKKVSMNVLAGYSCTFLQTVSFILYECFEVERIIC